MFQVVVLAQRNVLADPAALLAHMQREVVALRAQLAARAESNAGSHDLAHPLHPLASLQSPC